MKNKKYQLIGVFILIVLIFNSCFKDDLLKEIDALKTQVSDMQKRNDSLNSILNIRADSLSKALASAQKRSDSLSNVLKTKSDSLSIALGITNSNLASMSKSVDSIKTQIASISDQLTQLNHQLTSITTQLTQLNQQLGALGGDVSQLAAQYQALSASLQTINTQIAALQAEQLILLERLNAILLQLNPPVDITTGLLVYYPFSGNAGDSSGNGNHGQVNGATLTTDRFGIANKAFYFDGNDYVTANSVQFSDISFSFWYLIEPTTNLYPSFGHPPSGGQILGQGTALSPTRYCDFSLGISKIGTSNPGYALERGNGGLFEMFYANNPIIFSEWKNITIIISSNVIKLFENGLLKNTIPFNSSFIRNGSILSIGSRFVENAPNPPSNFFIGKIDDIRIYNRALTQSEITYLTTH